MFIDGKNMEEVIADPFRGETVTTKVRLLVLDLKTQNVKYNGNF